MSELTAVETAPEIETAPVVEGENPAVEGEQKPDQKVYTQEEVDRIASKIRSNTAARTKRDTEVEIYKSIASKPQEQEQANDQAVTREQFDSYEEYIEARAEKKALRSVEGMLSKFSAERAQAEQARTHADRYQSNAAAVRADTPDFDDVIKMASAPVSGEVRDAILNSDRPAKIQYHLAKNPGELERILTLPPMQQIMAIGALGSKLTTSPVRTTNAPPPIRSVSASGASAPKSLATMTIAEVRAQMRANGEL